MSQPTVIKLVLALLGVIAYFYGFNTGNATFRWVGLGLVFVAFLLRFYRPKGPST